MIIYRPSKICKFSTKRVQTSPLIYSEKFLLPQLPPKKVYPPPLNCSEKSFPRVKCYPGQINIVCCLILSLGVHREHPIIHIYIIFFFVVNIIIWAHHIGRSCCFLTHQICTLFSFSVSLNSFDHF